MEEGKRIRKLMLAAVAATLVLLCAIPVSAATVKGFRTTVLKNQCVHLMNNDIQKNAISQYTYQIIPQTSATRYDIVYAYGGTARALKNCRTNSGSITNSTYLKSSRTSNTGMIACIRVTNGSVNILMQVTSRSSNPSIQRWTKKNHSPLKVIAKPITKGKKINMTGKGGNISTLPLIISAKKGAKVQRKLTASSYETYEFKGNYMLFRKYVNKKRVSSVRPKYSTTNGSTKYYFMLIPQNSRGNAFTGEMTTTKGSVTYYYPSDYIKVRGSVR